jgi:hypothetical protein
VNKDKVCKLLGDLTAFVSIILLQAYGFDEKKAHNDKLLFSTLMGKVSKEIGLSEEDIIAITTYAQNYVNRKINNEEEE